MNTSLDCMPCFMDMAVRMARLARPDDVDLHRRVVVGWADMIGGLDLTKSPPVLAHSLWRLLEELTGLDDMYADDKRESDLRVMSLLPDLRKTVHVHHEAGGDRLAMALELSIIGNFIDRGVSLGFDWERALTEVEGVLNPAALAGFRAKTTPGANVLILGDNAGEIALDTLLVEELVGRGCQVTYAVRERPIINDATMEDARRVGMDKLCAVISSGSPAPGTVLEMCSADFVDRMGDADVVLSKGQGNFEALNECWPKAFFAFKVKCARVAEEVGLEIGATVFGQGTKRAPTALSGGERC